MIDKKQIGVFSGSFNPIHMGHLMLANYITEFTHIDEIWFVVTPHNPLKVVSNLAEEETRLKMCQLAVEDFPKLKVSEIEFSMPKPSFTVDTLDKLKNEYPELCFTLIIGADNWNEFHMWKEYKRIREENEILIYLRSNKKHLNNVSLNPFRIIIDEIMLTKNDKSNFKYNTKVNAKENIINLFKELVRSKHTKVKIKSII